ncbi:putative DNA binding domain-containing protein [Candidatus Aerophobetes bacterium]|nr:putative DNA binding domain-containing protein [Candidatus Aerophobetes bacterium]
MNELELKERILKGEDLHTEFKESFSKNEDIAKSIICFANTDGGQLLVGVSDTGEIVGVKNIDELLRRIDDVSYNRCEPPITIVQETLSIENRTVLIIHVPKGDQRPYRTASGLYYIRSANRHRQASREELLRLFQATESIYYDEIEILRASLKDVDMDYAKKFLETYFNLKAEGKHLIRYLTNIKAVSNNEKPTRAGILFFGENPQYYIPNGRISAAYIEGDDISTSPADKKNFEGRVSNILEDCMRFLKVYVKERHIIKGLEPENYPEIEDFVLREALVNTVAHRDYTISAPARLLIFSNRIEFHTPGKLPNTVTIENMKIGGAHVLRNPTIYNLLGKMGLVTDIGSGIKRIIESVKKTTGKNVKLKVIHSEFVLTIPRKRR